MSKAKYNTNMKTQTNGVYQIFINDYCYWGSSKDCESRCAGHLKDLKRGKHDNTKMQNVFNKYKTFDFQIIVACNDRDVAYAYEQDYIDAHFGLEKCMNLSAIASAPPSPKGKKRTAEHQEKLTASTRLRFANGEGKIPSSKGKSPTAETRAKISASLTGKPGCRKGVPHTDEEKKKLSEAYQNEAKFQCPHCSKSFRACHFKQWHGDNCKMKPMENNNA